MPFPQSLLSLSVELPLQAACWRRRRCLGTWGPKLGLKANCATLQRALGKVARIFRPERLAGRKRLRLNNKPSRSPKFAVLSCRPLCLSADVKTLCSEVQTTALCCKPLSQGQQKPAWTCGGVWRNLLKVWGLLLSQGQEDRVALQPSRCFQ